MRLTGKVALVTGASAGIGKGVARRLASEGADLWLADINAGAGEEVADQIQRDFGVGVSFGRTDVSERAEVEAMVQAALARFGRVDILVNNAWGPRPGRRGHSRLETQDDAGRCA